MHQLDPGIKTLWFLSYMMRTLFFSVVILIADLFFIHSLLEGWPMAKGYLPSGIFIFGLTIAIIAPPLKYRFWKFEVRDEEIYLERGVITRIKTIAPYRRVQHLDVEQNFIERMMGLSKLVIYTAGTRGADIIIPGLPIAYSEMLRDQLRNYTIEDAV